jgi:hydrogenase maturation factor HypE
MKRILLAVLALFISAGSIWAQNDIAPKPKKTAEQRAEQFSKKMTKNLNLDGAQQERIKAINLDRFKQIDEARNGEAGKKKEVAAKIKAINDTYLTTLKGVLTEEQFKKFEEMKSQLKENAMHNRAKGQ